MNSWLCFGLLIGLIAIVEAISAPIEWLFPYSLGGNAVWNGDKTRKVVSLTFDDGPSKYTEGILDLLKTRHLPATFFVLGSQAEQFPDTIRRMVKDGHEIGNHMYSYDAKRGLHKLCYPFQEDEVSKTQTTIQTLTSQTPRYFRSPGAQMGRNLWNLVRAHNLIVVNGKIPFPNPENNAAAQLETIKSTLSPGAIIILHDGNDHNPISDRPSATVELLPFLIDLLNKEGYDVVPLDSNIHR